MFEGESELEAELEDLIVRLSESDLQSEAERFGPFDQLRGFRERAIISNLIASGMRDEGKLTDAVFFDRHKERAGKLLKPGEADLRAEWTQIRDEIVRPLLDEPPPVLPSRNLTPGGDSGCHKVLPDRQVGAAEGGGPVVFPSWGGFYCINQPRVRLQFRAWWAEMLPPDQRPATQRNRAPNAPSYDLQFGAYKEANFIPGQRYVRDITVASPRTAEAVFGTYAQTNRTFWVDFSIAYS